LPLTSLKQALPLLLATLMVGAALGWFAGRAAPPPDPRSDEVLRRLEGQQALLEALPARLAAQAASQQVRCAVASASGAGVEAAELRAELARLREELGGTARSEPPRTPEPSPQAVAAQRQGHQLIEEASRSGQWRTEDAQALRQLLIDMNDAQRDEVTQRLVVQLNAGKLKPLFRGPIF
jgi:hypothetical protein